MAKNTWNTGDTYQASDQNAIATEVTNDTTALAAIAAVNGFIKSNGSGTYSAGTTFSGTLSNPTIAGYTEQVQALGTVTTTKTIGALTNGTFVTATLTASTACTFTLPTATAGQSFTLLLKQATTTGNGTATFTGVKWSGQGTPTQTPTAATMDIYTFISDGTDWYGSYQQGWIP